MATERIPGPDLARRKEASFVDLHFDAFNWPFIPPATMTWPSQPNIVDVTPPSNPFSMATVEPDSRCSQIRSVPSLLPDAIYWFVGLTLTDIMRSLWPVKVFTIAFCL